MLSVNQMFYGTDEPVWLVDGSSPSPVKYHYLGSAQKESRRSRDPHYPHDDYYDSPVLDPSYSSDPRREYSAPRSRSVRPPSYYNAPPRPPPVRTETYSSVNPPPAPVAARSRSVQTPNYHNAPTPPTPVATKTYSSVNPPSAPVVVPSETPISRTPVEPAVDRPSVPPNTPYTLLLKVPICCEGCEGRVVKRLLKVPGVVSVRCDIERQSATVRGTADTDEVLREAKKAFKKSRLW